MAFLSQITGPSNVKLKKTQIKQRPAVEPALCENSEQYHALMSETYFERYMDIIAPFTFASTVVPMSREAASGLVAMHAAAAGSWCSAPIRDDEALSSLASAIDQAHAALGVEYFFVRFSSRSPKDAALLVPNFGRLFRACFDHISADEVAAGAGSSSPLNRRMHALYVASTIGLRVRSGAEAIALLASSKRVQNDLSEFILGIVPELNVVVREFCYFPVELELRAFVYAGVLTAVTQYNNYVFFPRLVAVRARLEQLVREFVATLGPSLTLANYVLDLVLVSPCFHSPFDTSGEEHLARCDFAHDPLEVRVIELNPLAEFAGTGLFSFTEPGDREILLGRAPFEFRVRESEAGLQLEAATLPQDWQAFLASDLAGDAASEAASAAASAASSTRDLVGNAAR